MKISELSQKLNYKIATKNYNDNEFETGYTSDLLSDVMGNAEDGAIFITIQAHKNSVAVASQLDFAGIVICNSRQLPPDMIEAAEKEKIPVLLTDDNQFTASYKIYKAIHE